MSDNPTDDGLRAFLHEREQNALYVASFMHGAEKVACLADAAYFRAARIAATKTADDPPTWALAVFVVIVLVGPIWGALASYSPHQPWEDVKGGAMGLVFSLIVGSVFAIFTKKKNT